MSTSSSSEVAASARTLRVPNSWLTFAYSLVFGLFAHLLGLSFADLSPVRVDTSLDSRLLRFVVIEPDTKDAKVLVRASASDVRVQAKGLRSPGLTLAVETPLIEAPCPLGRAHTHSAEQVAEELEVRLEARALEGNARLQVGISEPAPERVPRRLRWAKSLDLAAEWRAFRVPLTDMRPPARSDARPGAVASILLRAEPPFHSALAFRHVSLLRVASPTREPSFSE